MNVLFGWRHPDSGTVLLDGNPVWLRGPRDAIRFGIGMVHQNLLFFPQLSVLENIIIGSEPARHGILDRDRAEKEILALGETFGFDIDPEALAGDLSFAARQQIELLRALHRKARVLILDEPTSFLGPHEVEKFLEILRALRAARKTVLFISHRLDEVFSIADRITVLRRGRLVATLDAANTSRDEVSRLMIGAGAADAGPRGAGACC